MSGLPRSKCLRAKPSEAPSPPKAPSKAPPDDPARNRCPTRGRPKAFVLGPKKPLAVQIEPHLVNRKPPARPGRYPALVEDKKVVSHFSGSATGNKSPSSSDDSFKAEENENELGSCVPAAPIAGAETSVKKTLPLPTGAAAAGNPRRGRSPPLIREHFEAEMNKHGLLDKIVNIQQLNNFFESEIGGSRRDNSPHASDFGGGSANISSNSQLDKILCENPSEIREPSPKGFTFPFQKRARSNSPPRNGQLFDHGRKPSPGRQPVVANFLVGAGGFEFGKKPSVPNEKFLGIDAVMGDTAGLSTGCTREDHASRGGKAKSGLGDDDWMYQRLDVGAGLEDEKVDSKERHHASEERGPAGGRGGGSDADFLKLINQLAVDCDAD